MNSVSYKSPGPQMEAIAVYDEAPAIEVVTAAPSPWARITQLFTVGRTGTALRGGAWTTIGYVASQVLRTVATLVLARHFLGPEPFGLVGLVGVFIAGLAMFSELGIAANVVQHARGDESGFLNTAFTIQVGRGVIIWLVALAAAYPVAWFYHQPKIVALLVAAAAAEMIRGMTSTAAWTLTRHVNLRGITVLLIISEVVAFGVGILWAVLSPSAWALVARTVAAAVVYAAGSHFIARPSMRFRWDPAAAKDILHFGGWISLSTAAYFLGGQGERLILGKFITAAELGCFSLALMISSVPAGGVNQLVGQIFLPMISKAVRSSQSEAASDYQAARKLFFGLGLFAALGFLVLSKPFVSLVLTSKYAMAGWMLQVLGIRVALDLFAAPATSLVLAYGQSRYSAAANTTRLVFMVGGVLVVFRYFGLPQAMVVLIVAQAISYVPLIKGLKKVLPEVAAAELRWYAIFVVLLGLAAAMPWPGVK
jgi:O-antigen/teichoic acid export membrane protein